METPKILLVDDVSLFLEIEKSFLKSKPVAILTARNGEEALELAARERPSLIFLDMHMPKMDGVICCAKIRENPLLKDIPVIIVTTAGAEADVEICRQVGCTDYLTKPVDRRKFLEMVCRYVPALDRRDPRIPCSIPVQLANGEARSAVGADISLGGMYVASEGEPGKESVVLDFTAPGTSPVTFRIKGRVAWRNFGDERPRKLFPTGFGVQFVEMDIRTLQGIRELITALINSRRTGGSGPSGG